MKTQVHLNFFLRVEADITAYDETKTETENIAIIDKEIDTICEQIDDLLARSGYDCYLDLQEVE